MKRAICLVALIAIGGFSMAVAGFQRGTPQPRPSIRTIQRVKDNLYVILGGDPGERATWTGGNTAVFIADNGVVVVDTMNAGYGADILAQIKSVTSKPVTLLINTHTHGDHTGSNVEFPVSIEFVVHENTRANMQKMDAFKGDKSAYLAKKTFKDRMSLLGGKDRIDLYYFGAGHTNGDTLVVFPAVRAMHAGDLFAGKRWPFIDASNGGSGVAMPETLAKAAAGIKNVDTVITGHTPAMTWADFQEYGDFNRDFVTAVRSLHSAGRTVDQAAAELKMPDKYKNYVAAERLKTNVQIVYNELSKK